MTDHEQQAIEAMAKKIDGLAFYVENDKYKQHEARDIARAIFQTLKSSGYQYVPEGFVVVPKKPTATMIEAGRKAFSYHQNLEAQMIGNDVQKYKTAERYRAMIEAAKDE